MKIQIDATPEREIRDVRWRVEIEAGETEEDDRGEGVETFEGMESERGEDCWLVELVVRAVKREQMAAVKAVVLEVGVRICGKSDDEHFHEEQGEGSIRHGFLKCVDEGSGLSLMRELKWPRDELRHDQQRARHSLDFLPVELLARRIVGRFLGLDFFEVEDGIQDKLTKCRKGRDGGPDEDEGFGEELEVEFWIVAAEVGDQGESDGSEVKQEICSIFIDEDEHFFF